VIISRIDLVGFLVMYLHARAKKFIFASSVD